MFRGSESNAKFKKKNKKMQGLPGPTQVCRGGNSHQKRFFPRTIKLCEFTIGFKVIPPGEKAKSNGAGLG